MVIIRVTILNAGNRQTIVDVVILGLFS